MLTDRQKLDIIRAVLNDESGPVTTPGPVSSPGGPPPANVPAGPAPAGADNPILHGRSVTIVGPQVRDLPFIAEATSHTLDITATPGGAGRYEGVRGSVLDINGASLYDFDGEWVGASGIPTQVGARYTVRVQLRDGGAAVVQVK